jgi:hypothetical protein
VTRPLSAHTLRAAHQQLRRDGTVDLELGSLDQLLDDSLARVELVARS